MSGDSGTDDGTEPDEWGDDGYHDGDHDEYGESDSDEYEDDWESDEDAGGFLMGGNQGYEGEGNGGFGFGVEHARDPGSLYAPPVRCKVTPKDARRCPHGNDLGMNDHASFAKQESETDLAFFIRKSMWRNAREVLGAKALAAGAAGKRLVGDDNGVPTGLRGAGVPTLSVTKSKGKGQIEKAPEEKTKKKGKGKAAAKDTKGHTNKKTDVPTVDSFDLINALVARAPVDVLQALLAIAPLKEIKHRCKKERGGFEGCSLLHFAVHAVHSSRHKPANSCTPLPVFKRLLQLDPEAVCQVSKDGFTPLYVLARFGVAYEGASDKVMASVVDAMAAVSRNAPANSKLKKTCGGAAILAKSNVFNPQTLSQDQRAAYPLHGACVRHFGKTLQSILKAFPEAAKHRVEVPQNARSGVGAGYPLHLLFMGSPNKKLVDLQTFKAILDAHPTAASEPSKTRQHPQHVLHFLCCHREAPVPLIKHLLKKVPSAARIVENGETALHVALDFRVGNYNGNRETATAKQKEIVDALLGAWNGACSLADNEDAYPIHIAVKRKWGAELCGRILALDPASATKKDRDGDLPLHVATRNGTTDTVIEILRVAPELAKIVSEDDGTPLHVAARHSAPVQVTKALLDAYPDGAKVEDGEGEFPLHAVCAALGSDDLMDETSEAENENDRRDFENAKLLYEHFPDAVHYTDAKGKIPAERLPMYDVHRMLSRDVFGGDLWRGEGWRVVGANGGNRGTQVIRSATTDFGRRLPDTTRTHTRDSNIPNYTQHPHPQASGAALLVRVAANAQSIAAMSQVEIERLTVALEVAQTALSKETMRRPFEEELLREHDETDDNNEKSETWMCPIGYGLFRDPVKAGDGHVYERSNIVKWQEKSTQVKEPTPGTGGAKRVWKSPMTGLPCDDFVLTPVTSIKNAIDKKLGERVAAARGETRVEATEADGANVAAVPEDTKTKGKGKAHVKTSGANGSRGTKRPAQKAQAAPRATRARRGGD